MTSRIIINPHDPSRGGTESEWHKWFAWYPIRTIDDEKVWLEIVYRRKIYSYSFASRKYWCDYRKNDDERKKHN